MFEKINKYINNLFTWYDSYIYINIIPNNYDKKKKKNINFNINHQRVVSNYPHHFKLRNYVISGDCGVLKLYVSFIFILIINTAKLFLRFMYGCYNRWKSVFTKLMKCFTLRAETTFLVEIKFVLHFVNLQMYELVVDLKDNDNVWNSLSLKIRENSDKRKELF